MECSRLHFLQQAIRPTERVLHAGSNSLLCFVKSKLATELKSRTSLLYYILAPTTSTNIIGVILHYRARTIKLRFAQNTELLKRSISFYLFSKEFRQSITI